MEKELMLKQWYLKKYLMIDKGETGFGFSVLDKSTKLYKQTDKAICLIRGAYNSYGNLIRIEYVWLPKSALVLASDEEEFVELNDTENKDISLKEIQKYLDEYNFYTFEEAFEELKLAIF